MDKNEKMKILSEDVLMTGDIVLDEDILLESLIEWDSMAALCLIAMLEEKFSRVDIGGEEIAGLTKVSNVLDLMENVNE